MNEFKVKEHTYRIKRMNMIEVLALQSQITFKNTEKTYQMYNELLERIEVQIGDKWLPVKSKDMYFPNDVENDIETIQILIGHFLEYLKSVFRNSNE